jgi:protein-tyrosine-phosphatase
MLRPRIILLLSTGDTCRSPMAAVLLRHLLEQHRVRGVDVRTAGVETIVGLLASQETIQVLKTEGLDASKHRSNQLSTSVLRRASLILGMTPLHVQRALRLYPEARGKIHLLKEYTRSDLKKVQIDDPMGGTLEIYRRCYLEIRAALRKLVFMPEAIGQKVEPLEPPKPPAKPTAAAKPQAKPKPKPKPKPKAKAKPAAKKAAKKTAKKKAVKKKSTAKAKPKKAAKKTAAKRKPVKKKPAAKKKPATKKKAAAKKKPAAKRKSAAKRKPAAKKKTARRR